MFLKTKEITAHQLRPQTPDSMIDFKEHLPHTKTATSCSRSLSVLFVPKHMPPLAHVCVDNQNIPKQSEIKHGMNFQFTFQQTWKRVHNWYLCFLDFHGPLQQKQASAFLLSLNNFLDCSQTRLQTFHLTIRTSSTNSGFALRLRFATTKFTCSSFLPKVAAKGSF